MGASGARHGRVPGRRGGGARRRARPAPPIPPAERHARRTAPPAAGGADPRGAGARGAPVDRRGHARGGAAGAPARRGGRRAQKPVRRRGRDPGSGEDGGTPMSGIARKPLYTADDLAGFEDERQLGRPGEYPFTRGIHPTMYRGRLWTMRQFAGFGSAQDTNQRYKFLLEHGQTGLSVAFDFPTLMGYDSDHARAEGEVGKCGVAIASLADMEDLFRGIPLDQVSTSMTINGPAAILFCFYVAAAERQGVPIAKLRGTVQNDILKEYMAQHAWVYPVEPALKVIVDMFEWGAKHTPLWNTISISGYHIREAGATAAQELAFTLANGFTYVERGIARGLDIDSFAARLSFFWDIHNDFFEEIAKLRAARRIWARHMRERYKAKQPRSWMMRFHSQTAGVTLTAQQPLNNIVRVAYQARAVGGGLPTAGRAGREGDCRRQRVSVGRRSSGGNPEGVQRRGRRAAPSVGAAAGGARQRPGRATARRAAPGGGVGSQRHRSHARLRARLCHALRNPTRPRACLGSLPRTRILLTHERPTNH